MEAFNPVTYKVPSAALTDHGLLKKLHSTGRPVILSTGMSTIDQIHSAVQYLDMNNLVICHTTSAYPCAPEELNLRMIETLQRRLPLPDRLFRA